MLKCPFCGFANEDGSLFCEQCKSDLSAVAPTPAEPPKVEPEVPMAQVLGDDPLPMGEVIDVQTAEVVSFETPVAVPPADIFPVGSVDLGERRDTPEPETTPIVSDEAVTADVPPEQVAPAPVPGMAPPLEIKSPGEPLTPTEVQEAVAEGHPVHPADQPAGSVPVAAPVATSAPTAAAPAAGNASVPAGAQPKLAVMRGLKIGVEFPIYPGENYVGRADEKPVDVDLEDQEPPDRVWCSRQHAVILYDDNANSITVEDLNSSNGTYVNRQRVYPGQPRQLFVNDTIQIGTVHLKLKV